MSAPPVNIKMASAPGKETEAYIAEMMQNFNEHFPKLKVTHELCEKGVIKFFVQIPRGDVLSSEAVTKFQSAYNLHSFLYDDGDKMHLVFNSYTPIASFPKVTPIGFAFFLVALLTVAACGSIIYQGVDNTPFIGSMLGAARFDSEYTAQPRSSPDTGKKTNPYATNKEKKPASSSSSSHPPTQQQHAKKPKQVHEEKEDIEVDENGDEEEKKKPEVKKPSAAKKEAQKNVRVASDKKKDSGREITAKNTKTKGSVQVKEKEEETEDAEANNDEDDDSYHKVDHEDETEL